MADDTATVMNDGTSMTDQPSETTSTTGRRARSGGKSSGVRSAVKEKLTEQGSALRGQAQAKAREYAELGKSKAADTLDGFSRFFGDTANALDEQLGPELGEYMHRAADAVAGFTDTLKQKDVEELFEDAREAVRRNPALAIGAAAAAGFVLMRLLKSASPNGQQGTKVASRTGKASSAESNRANS